MSGPSRSGSEKSDAGREAPLVCPKCRGVMERVREQTIEVDRCVRCGGLWLDALEKERLLDLEGAARRVDHGRTPAADRHNQTTRIGCPRDHSAMIHMVDLEQPHVGFESCTVCGGAFLDAGELRDLDELTLRERLARFGRLLR